MHHKHHIIPKHMGGSDDPSNLKLVTVEQHAEEHRLLWEKYGKKEDFIAWQALSGNISSEEARVEAVKAANTGRKQTEEHKKKRVASRMKTCPTPTLGKKLPAASQERKQKISEANKGNAYALGRKQSDKEKQKRREIALDRPKLRCPKCSKEMTKAALVRYHGLEGEKCST